MNRTLRLLVLLLGIIPAAYAQQTRQITGQIKDNATGTTLPGVSVVLKGTSSGATSDADGKYAIRVPDKSDVKLTFSFIGYVPQEVSVGSRATLDISLATDEKTLNEVVVIGYEAVNRRDVTGSVSSVNSRQIRDVPITNAAEAITGRLAGVQVTTAEGGPGADIRIRVRGGNSITQDNSPIYVVDGIQLDNALNTISPQDIASIDVLKDASATAIYGARGANGVVIITTKSGRTNSRTTVTYNGSFGFRENLKQLPVLKPYDYVLYQYERTRGSATDSSSFARQYGSTFDTLQVYKNAPFIDWQDNVFGRRAGYQNHNVSINGGNQQTSYNLSLTNNKEDGIQLGSAFTRNLANFKLDHAVNSKFKVGVVVRYIDQRIDGAGTTTSGTAGTNRLRQSIQYQPLDLATRPASAIEFDEDYYLSTRLTNPVTLTGAEYQKRFTNGVNLSGYATYDFAPGLTLRVTAGYANNVDRTDQFYSKITGTARNYASLPVAIIRNSTAITINNSNVLTYRKAGFGGGKHDIDALIGQETYETNGRAVGLETRYFPSEISPEKALANMNLGSPPTGAIQPQPTSAEYQNRLLSFFGRLNYSYDKKYLATATFRADGSTKFAPENRWAYFPSGSLAWRFSQEEFMKSLKFVDDAKLRVSYGAAGNNRVNDYLYAQLYNTSAQYALGESVLPAFSPVALAQANLTWETTYSRNIGLDLSLLGGRVQFTADYYQNTTKNLLVNLPIPSTSGYTTQIKNVGATSNRGLEFQLNGTVMRTNDFTWNASANISFNRNRIEDLGPVLQQTTNSGWQGSDGADDYILKVGEPVGLMYGFVTDDFYKVDDFTYNATTRTYTLKEGIANDATIFGTPQPGTIKLKDLNGDGQVRLENDRTVIGNANPKHIGGMNNQFSYKSFDLSVFVNWVYGNSVYNANKIEFTSGYYLNTNMLEVMNNRWRTIDDKGVVVKDPSALAALNANATIWQPITNNRPYLHSWAVEDGSFLRINNITLGYSIPKDIIRKVKVQTARFYATVNNVATITGYSGFDPEVNARRFNPLTPGVDYAAYPRARTFVFGVNLTF
ncbi:SusC/RagA family TonB-linked outer membrane protein [Fibrella forsythiae]|uniref:TonB-dependent receptor n=1 Tax=Fibrella forsythiae TaxID=2817061 RepID=A0ABS3JQ18_9BACT|nr:TonB-dependent receptor [Fibrella forsythiae]MBO0951314.1 TonB-dependent receptor [Fibrella forsythiae]